MNLRNKDVGWVIRNLASAEVSVKLDLFLNLAIKCSTQTKNYELTFLPGQTLSSEKPQGEEHDRSVLLIE